MFLWVPALVVGLLVGVLLAEATRPAAALAARPSPARRPRRSEQISPWLVWTMRAAVVAEVAAAASLWSAGELPGARRPAGAGAAPASPGCWPRSRCCGCWCGRCRRRAPTCRSTRRCAPGPRTWSPPRPACWRLLPLGALLLVAGIGLGDRVTRGLRPAAGGARRRRLLRAGRRDRGGGLPAHLAAAGAGDARAPWPAERRACGGRTGRCPARAVAHCGLGHRDRRHLRSRPSGHSRHGGHTAVSARPHCRHVDALVHSLCTVASRSRFVIVS